MLTPEELEIERLELSLHENPEITKALYGYVAEALDGIIDQLVEDGALECTPEQIINSLIGYRDGLRQVSAL